MLGLRQPSRPLTPSAAPPAPQGGALHLPPPWRGTITPAAGPARRVPAPPPPWRRRPGGRGGGGGAAPPRCPAAAAGPGQQYDTDVEEVDDEYSSCAFSNEEDPACTVVRLCARNDASLLGQLTAVFERNAVALVSANLNTDADGLICDVFRVTDAGGGKIPLDRWPGLESEIMSVLSSTSRSVQPAIFGVASEEGAQSSVAVALAGDVDALEAAVSEMTASAATLVAAERAIIALAAERAPDASALLARQNARAEASAALERKMAAMEAILTSRRVALEVPVEAAKPRIPDIFLPPPVKTTGPAAGSGYEIILQGFNWESCKEPGGWYRKLAAEVPAIAAAGFTAVWLPPVSDAVSPQGYLPRDLYDLNSKYGTESELRDLVATLHDAGLKAVADIVINHRCAHYQGEGGKWNKFGGRLAWDASVITSNNPAFGGRGAWKEYEDYAAAPNLDHSQERVRRDIAEWLRYLRTSIGFDGWRFDFVKGYDGAAVGEYVNATVPTLAFGEYWDTCAYTDGVLNYNQDAHRQRTVDWCDRTGATCAAFDFTTKGVLQEAVARREYWRLIDSRGRPPGVLGLWPSRAITFLENHDTGSTLQHWPFPWKRAAEGYAYLLTHCGTPCVFYDHLYFDEALRSHIMELLRIRRAYGINCKSEVRIVKAFNNLYAAVVDGKVAMKIGGADWSPSAERVDGHAWELLHSGPNFAVWKAEGLP